MLETVIQKTISKRLKSLGYAVIRLRATDVAGFPDLLALKNGVATFIEVKRPGEVPTPLQLKKHADLRKQGFKVLVMDGRELFSEYF